MDDTSKVLELVRPAGVASSVLVLAATWFASRLISTFTERLGVRFTDRRLLIHQLGTFLRFGFYIVAFGLVVALSFRLSREMVLALGGTLAVTIGFALKDLSSSVIAGLTLLIDRPFQVGDRVSFGGYYGEIRSIGLRSVRLVTLDDNVVTIPNNKFLTEVVACGNDGALDMLVQLDFFVGADQDLRRAKQIVSDAITSCRFAYLAKPWTVLVNQVVHEGYFALRLRAKVYVLDLQYEKALETDVTERVVAGFAEAGVAPPAMLWRAPGGREAPPPASRAA